MQMHVAKELLSPSFFKEDQSISMVMHREGDSVGDSFNPDSIFHPTGGRQGVCKQLFSTIKKPASSLKVKKVPRKSKTAPSPYASSSHLSSALPPPLPPPLPLPTRTLLSPLSLHDLNILHGLTKAPTFSRSPDIMLNFNRKDLKVAMERDRRIVRGASQPNMSYTGLTGSTSERLNVLDLSDLDREGEGVVLSAKSEGVIGCASKSPEATSSSHSQQQYQHQSTTMCGKESKVMNISSNNNIDSGKGRENKKDVDTTKNNNNGKYKGNGKGRDKGKLKSVRLAALVRDKGAGESVSIRKASYLKRPSQLNFGEIYDGGDEGDRDKDRDRDRERGVNKDHHISHSNGAIPFNRNDYRTAVRSDLASVDRKIRIYNISTDHKRGMSPECLSGSEVSPPPGDSTCCFTPRQSDCRSFHTAQAKLFCWVLAQRRTLLVRAELPDSFPVIGVEAEVSVRDLAAIRGLDVDALLIDPELERIAREIIEEAELTVEDREVARSKSNDVFDGSHLKQRIGQVVSIVVHLSRPGDPSKKHHSTAQAFVDALTQMERAGDGTWTSHSGVHESLVPHTSSPIVLNRVMRIPVMRTVYNTPVRTLPHHQNQHQRTFFPQVGGVVRKESAPEFLPQVGGVVRKESAPELLTSLSLISTDTIPAKDLEPINSDPLSDNMKGRERKLSLTTPPDFNINTAFSPHRMSTSTPMTRSNPVSPPRAKLIHDRISASLTISTNVNELDKAYVTVRFLEESDREEDGDEDKEEEDNDHDIDNPESCAAIFRDTIVTVTTGLPSIVQADPELTLEFFENLLEGLSVQHDSKSRTNTCHFNTK